MASKNRLLSILFASVLLLMVSSLAIAQNNIPIPPEYQPLIDKAREDGAVRVIVQVHTPTYRSEGFLLQSQAQMQRAQIQQAQTMLIGDLAGLNVDENARFNVLPYIALTVDENALLALIQSRIVSHIEEDRQLFLTLDQSVPLIGGTNVHNDGYLGDGQVVAVIDTGVDSAHPFLEDRVIHEACFSTDDFIAESTCPNGEETQIGTGSARPCVNDGSCFHGTHVAGIVAGRNNEFTGVAPNAEIIAIQVFYEITFPVSGISTNFSNVMRALEHVYMLATEQNINVVSANLSLGSPNGFSQTCESSQTGFADSVDLLRSIGVATIAASGNASFTNGISEPSCMSNIISVGSTEDDDTVSDFSNSSDFLDLLAPGGAINSAITPGTNPNAPEAIYGSAGGTSMAAPHVAGAWALIRQAHPNASIDDILTALQSTGIPVADTRDGANNRTLPRIQVDLAIQALNDGIIPPRYMVVVNEVQTEGTRAVEIYNKEAVPIEMSAWALDFYASDDTLESTFTFPPGFVLPANSYAVVFGTNGTDTATQLYAGGFGVSWGDGGAVRLENGFIGRDFVRWGSASVTPNTGTGWAGTPLEPPAEGETLSRDRQHRDTDVSTDFFSNNPTLGANNDADLPPGFDPNDFDGARIVDALPYTDAIDVSNYSTAVDDPDPTCYQPPILYGGGRVNRSAWYRYIPVESGLIEFTTAGTDYGTVLSVWQGERGNLTMVACHDDVDGFPLYNDPTSRVVMNVQAGETYHIMVSAGAFLGNYGYNLVFNAQNLTLDNDDIDSAWVIDALDFSGEMNVSNATVANDDPSPTC